ncbi:MAG TPA: choice-of-anchor P family protein [Mycobacteriales bacterium]|nr:choice-of-anchor P family protein [Mycobacteriales bacterium]
MTRPGRRSALRRITIGTGMVAVVAIGPVATAVVNGHASASASQRTAAKAAGSADVGSGLGSVTADANATALRIPFYSHQGEDAEAELPFAQSTLQSGGVGASLTSIFWPGDTGGHAGDILSLLGLNQIPQNIANLLNDPFKASAQTGTGDATDNLSQPGLEMTATALPTHVSAVSSLGGAGIPVLGPALGKTEASTDIKITGPKTLTVDASSTIHNFSIGGTALTIDAITSVAHATSDGATAHGTGHTTLAGVKVAGVPVSIDDKGIHLATSLLPKSLLNTLSNLVNKTLAQLGLSISLPQVTKHVHGHTASVQASGLEVRINKAGIKSGLNDTGKLLVLGGVTADASATHAFTGPNTPITTPPPPPAQTGGGTPSSTGGGGNIPAVNMPGNAPGTGATSGPPNSGTAPVLAQKSTHLPTAVPVAWVILALIGCALVAAVLNLLPGGVMGAGAGAVCTLEEDK